MSISRKGSYGSLLKLFILLQFQITHIECRQYATSQDVSPLCFGPVDFLIEAKLTKCSNKQLQKMEKINPICLLHKLSSTTAGKTDFLHEVETDV